MNLAYYLLNDEILRALGYDVFDYKNKIWLKRIAKIIGLHFWVCIDNLLFFPQGRLVGSLAGIPFGCWNGETRVSGAVLKLYCLKSWPMITTHNLDGRGDLNSLDVSPLPSTTPCLVRTGEKANPMVCLPGLMVESSFRGREERIVRRTCPRDIVPCEWGVRFDYILDKVAGNKINNSYFVFAGLQAKWDLP